MVLDLTFLVNELVDAILAAVAQFINALFANLGGLFSGLNITF